MCLCMLEKVCVVLMYLWLLVLGRLGMVLFLLKVLVVLVSVVSGWVV